MIRLDYNKIMYVLGIICIILFAVFLVKDYIWYKQILFLLLGLVFLYLYNQNTKVKKTSYNLNSNKLNNKEKFKIAHISDFHNTNSKRIKQALMQELLKEKPDIIVITGDLIDSRRTNFSTAKEFVNVIVNIAPVYYVLGNHESRLENIQKLESVISSTGVNIVRNKKIELTDKIELIGLDDPAFYIDFAQEIEEKQVENIVHEKLESIIDKEEKFKILLTHRPELINTYAKSEVDLIFTGHAHGGQIRIPFVGGIIAPGQGLFPKFTNGIHSINSVSLVISRGIGNSKFPFRINNRPELVIANIQHI